MSDNKEITDKVRAILLTEWDPIGIVDEPKAQDEYDTYTGPVLKLVLAGVSVNALADYLVGIERDRMELVGDRARATRAARHLVSLKR
jgi:hypothetical protein